MTYIAKSADALVADLADITPVQGEVLYVNGSGDLVALGVGTSGDMLTTNGAGADPTWTTAGGGVALGDSPTWTGDHTFSADAEAITLSSATTKRISFGSTGSTGLPTTKNATADGCRLLLEEAKSASTTNVSIGVGANNDMWFSTAGPISSANFKWYYNTVKNMQLSGEGGILQLGDGASASAIHMVMASAGPSTPGGNYASLWFKNTKRPWMADNTGYDLAICVQGDTLYQNTIELGNTPGITSTTDATLARAAAGVLTIEGQVINQTHAFAGPADDTHTGDTAWTSSGISISPTLVSGRTYKVTMMGGLSTSNGAHTAEMRLHDGTNTIVQTSTSSTTEVDQTKSLFVTGSGSVTYTLEVKIGNASSTVTLDDGCIHFEMID